MALHHESLLAAGTRLFGVSIDSPRRQAAMVDKLRLPFPLLSDPDRAALIEPLGLSNLKDPRNLALPALVLFAPGDAQEEVWRWVSRDFADRLPEAEVIDRVRREDWPATTQSPPQPGPAEPGPKAVSLDWLIPYLRGARFASLAMGLRHAHLDDSVKEDSKAYVAEMDRYIDAVRTLREQIGPS